MRILLVAALACGLAACADNRFAAAQLCARTAGCVSSVGQSTYGAPHARAAAPDNGGLLPPPS